MRKAGELIAEYLREGKLQLTVASLSVKVVMLSFTPLMFLEM